MNFDPNNPDKKLVAQVLYQAFPYGTSSGIREVYAEAWCLRDMELPAYRALEKHLLDNKLIEPTGEDDYFRITRKGEDVSQGEDY